uniref:Uncharacterized protein n=1 Tax=Peronospora matthiolae TaxID=2874970 RepID=A0AAV1U8N1_9STRA
MTDSGKCTFVLFFKVIDGPDGGATICQCRYVNDIIKRFGMEKCKYTACPFDPSSQLVPTSNKIKVDTPFCEAVRALLHLVLLRALILHML